MVICVRILLVEDEPRLADALACILRAEKYIVDVANDGTTAQDLAETDIYDIIVLDRMLPGKDGVSVLKELRAKKIKSAVIFLTAKDSVANRIEGLDAGADDYLVKPFSKEELLARIRALGRRPKDMQPGNYLEIGNLLLDTKQCRATVGSTAIQLTAQESRLLELFILNKNQVLSKEQILNRVWGFDKDVEINNVELYVFYLRKKISSAKASIRINTIRGIGYCLQEADHDQKVENKVRTL